MTSEGSPGFTNQEVALGSVMTPRRGANPGTFLDWCRRAPGNPWFAYGAILLLQVKTIWGLWLFRDLPSGDTSRYFIAAWDWYRNGHVASINWSPMYASFYGTVLHLSTDAYLATTAHRLITVLILSVLVLALMRQLLPPGIAWLMAAWWVVLPINFDAAQEVHLFAVIPILAAFLAILWKPGPWGRGWGLAALLAATVLMRIELLPAALLFGALAIGWDLRQKHRGLRQAYGIPLAVACLVFLFFYTRSTGAPGDGGSLGRRHTFNLCQIYAFGYQQRQSDWKGSAFLDCEQLMTRVYGTPEPSLIEALRRNPKAMLEHFWWNLRLAPNSLQMLLFNCMSGSVTPDYGPAPSRFLTALIASILALTITFMGLATLWRQREHWWRFWLKERIWAWMAIACVTIAAMIVMIVARPRPSFILPLGIVLRAVVGMCLFAVASGFPRLKRLEPAMPAAIVITILLAPSYYYVTNPGGVRPLLDIYWRLAPFQSRLERPGTGLVAIGAWDLCNYLGKSAKPGACRPLDTSALRFEVTSETPWNKILDKYGATLFYADDVVMADPLGRQFVSEAGSHGWHVVAVHSEPGQNWAVLERTGTPAVAAPAVLSPTADIMAPDSGITFGKGWYEFEIFGGERFRWVSNDADLIIHREDPGPVSLLLNVQPGPSLGGKPLSIQAFGNGKKLPVVNGPNGQTLNVLLPSGNMEVRLHVDSANRVTPGDPRILNFRVFKISVQ